MSNPAGQETIAWVTATEEAPNEARRHRAFLPATRRTDPQVCGTTGRVETVGRGTLGATGVPLLEHVGLPIENEAFGFEVSGGRPFGPGLFLASLHERPRWLPRFGGVLHPAPPFAKLWFQLDTRGASPALFRLSPVPNLCGLELVSQAFVLDETAAGGVAFTRALRSRFRGPTEGPLFAGQSLARLSSTGTPRPLIAGYLNGDDALDLVSIESEDRIAVYLGKGDGTFAGPQVTSTGREPVCLALGDLDGDRTPDLAVANLSSNDVGVLLGQGDGSFLATPPTLPALAPTSLAVGDLNGDDVLDLAVTERPGQVSVVLGVGDGTFAGAQAYVLGLGARPGFVAIANLNGDDIPDLAVAQTGVDSITVLLGVGDGTFGAP